MKTPSGRETELLEAAYLYAKTHGLGDLTLRPLAATIGSSPRVLLYLFGSRDGLVRALLARARRDELQLLDSARIDAASLGLGATIHLVWQWLAATEHRPLLCLWVEAYARSLVDPDGPWAGFAHQTVEDWLGVLAASQSARRRRSRAGLVERTAALAVLRGALLDLLATGDQQRASAAVESHIRTLQPRS